MKAEQLTAVEVGMERTPSEAWSSITPQLLSLMQHGQPWLRTFVAKLLGRLAEEWPHLLLFPVAAGAAGLTGTTRPLLIDIFTFTIFTLVRISLCILLCVDLFQFSVQFPAVRYRRK